jgi:hypothetical protein
VAVIKYQINGKADTKPIKNTEAAAQGMFKKIEAIDNKLKAFVGVKVFQEVSKAVKGALTEYDTFQKSLNGESNVTKQFDSIKTSLAGTLGTVRDELFNILGDITGQNGFKVMEDVIPKIGAALIGSFSVAREIVLNIKDNFGKFLNPEIWNIFFTEARNIGFSFSDSIAKALKDAFSFAIDFLKWALTNLNIMHIILAAINNALWEFGEKHKIAGINLAPQMDLSRFEEKNKRNPAPTFSFSAETQKAFRTSVDGAAAKLKSLLNTAAGKDVQELYTREHKKALEKLNFTIDQMNRAKNDKGPEKPDKAPKAPKPEKPDNPEKIEIPTLGQKLGAWLGETLNASMGKAGKLLGQSLGNIADLFGDVSTAINAIFTGNPLGLIITLITRLFDTFSKISGPFAAFMNIFDVFFDVVEDVCAVLEPALGAIFIPILDVVRSLGRVFGILMNFLTPIITILAQIFVPVLKILHPILFAVGLIFAILADAIGYVYNFISKVVKAITFGFVDMGSQPTDNTKTLMDQGVLPDSNYDEYKNSNNSTSYSVAGDMYINISFSHSFVNGDTREIAIMLRDEIRLAEGKGY